LIAASFVFFFGSGLFNTIYAAGLKQYGLKSYMVFLIFFVTQIIQIAAFMKSARYIKNRPKDQISSKFLIIRGSAYIAIGAIFAFAFVINLYFAYFNLLFYLIGAGVAYAFYYIASNTLFFEAIKGMDRGKSLGVYSAITSIGLFVGSYVSGYIAYLIGYADVFFIAGALMFASAAMFMFLSKKKIVAVLA
jgi:MFS family permease